MPFCTNCGKEISLRSRFCGLCGADQLAYVKTCKNCGKNLEESEKFCSNCGTPTTNSPEGIPESKIAEPPKKKENITPEGRKIIASIPKSTRKQSTKPPLAPQPPKKKIKGCLAFLFKTFVIVLILFIAAITLLYFASDWLDEPKDILTDTNIPGIVDIEPGNDNNPVIPDTETSDQPIATPVKESNDVKELSEMVELAFAKADTVLLKQLLTETSLEKYSGVFKEIQPYMTEYANAFKNRKLVHSNSIFSLYAFEDEEGNKFTAEFASTGNGNWKLVRF
jgi:RNA polymerase subunit RPABC4/transcription elongation factor Spt4